MRALLLAALLCGTAARAQSLNAQGVARLNQDLQSLWTHDGVPMAQTAAQAEAQKLVGASYAINGKTTATIVAINGLTLDLAAPPGARQLDGRGVDVALPLSGAWSAALDARVHVKGKILFFKVDQTFNVRAALTGITADLSARFDSSDPAAPRVTAVNPPVVHFNLKVTSSNFVVELLGWLSSGLVDGIVGQGLVAVAAVVVAHRLDLMVAHTPEVMNAGGPALAAFPRGPLELAAAKLGDEIEKDRTPFGPVLEMRFDAPYSGTWGDSLRDPAFNPGHPVEPSSYGDSGEMTGHYLAALAFQYAATHDPVAKTRAQRALATLRTLLTMRGEPGNMNRSIMPIWYLPAGGRPPTAYTPGQDYAQAWNGDLYYFTDYTSRDEYMGLFYGLSFAHDLFDDPQLKASAQESTEMALDYLLRNGWTWRRRNGAWGERWAGVLEEQYAWVLSAWHGNPAKYQAVRDQYHGFSDLLWTGYWMAAVDPYDSYYKFQLGSGSIHVLLAHETDPAAWMRSYQAVAVMRHYIGHHLNAHFNNTYLAFDPASRARLGAENENLLSRWLSWPRRRQRVDLHGDPTIEKVDFTPPLDPGSLYPAGHQGTVQIAKYPLPPDQRIGSGFMWSVSPCQLDPGYPAGPDANIEGETLDFVLPYWMARYYGAIAAPGGSSGPPALSRQ